MHKYNHLFLHIKDFFTDNPCQKKIWSYFFIFHGFRLRPIHYFYYMDISVHSTYTVLSSTFFDEQVTSRVNQWWFNQGFTVNRYKPLQRINIVLAIWKFSVFAPHILRRSKLCILNSFLLNCVRSKGIVFRLKQFLLIKECLISCQNV